MPAKCAITFHNNPQTLLLLAIEHTTTLMLLKEETLAQTRRYPWQERKCPACGAIGHRLRNCQEFRQMNVQNRLDVVDRHGLCKLCLNQHGLRRCLSRFRCEINGCEARHNALLHLPSATNCAELLAHNGTTKAGVLFRIVSVASWSEKYRDSGYPG